MRREAEEINDNASEMSEDEATQRRKRLAASLKRASKTPEVTRELYLARRKSMAASGIHQLLEATSPQASPPLLKDVKASGSGANPSGSGAAKSQSKTPLHLGMYAHVPWLTPISSMARRN